MNGTSVQIIGTVPGRTYQRDTVPDYPDYGPAWVADCYGTNHPERVNALIANGTLFDESDDISADDIAVMYNLIP